MIDEPEPVGMLPIEMLMQRKDAPWERDNEDDDKILKGIAWIKHNLARMHLMQKLGATEEDEELNAHIDYLHDTIRSAFTRQELIRLTFYVLNEEAIEEADSRLEEFRAGIKTPEFAQKKGPKK